MTVSFVDDCGMCHLRRYRVVWDGSYALLCAACDWGVTLKGQVSEKPTWWWKIIGG